MVAGPAITAVVAGTAVDGDAVVVASVVVAAVVPTDVLVVVVAVADAVVVADGVVVDAVVVTTVVVSSNAAAKALPQPSANKNAVTTTALIARRIDTVQKCSTTVSPVTAWIVSATIVALPVLSACSVRTPVFPRRWIAGRSL